MAAKTRIWPCKAASQRATPVHLDRKAMEARVPTSEDELRVIVNRASEPRLTDASSRVDSVSRSPNGAGEQKRKIAFKSRSVSLALREPLLVLSFERVKEEGMPWVYGRSSSEKSRLLGWRAF
jgi:hypothetical protein